jgi:hypothetical protein
MNYTLHLLHSDFWIIIKYCVKDYSKIVFGFIIFAYLNVVLQWCVVAYTCHLSNPSTSESETGGFQVQG